MISNNITAGTLLVSQPNDTKKSILDRWIFMLAQHDKEGSIGFILNKPSAYRLSDIVPNIQSDFVLHFGGDIEKDNLYFIHNVPHLIGGSQEIAEGIYWGGDFDTVVELIDNGVITKDNIKFFLGYSAWGGLKLQSEITQNSWRILKKDFSKAFQNLKSTFWNKKVLEIKNNAQFWENAPKDPRCN